LFGNSLLVAARSSPAWEGEPPSRAINDSFALKSQNQNCVTMRYNLLGLRDIF
jgi:hypothetical protein